jgi:hypothetical protein
MSLYDKYGFLSPSGRRSYEEVSNPLRMEGYVEVDQYGEYHLWLTPIAAKHLIRDLMECVMQSQDAGGDLHVGRLDIYDQPMPAERYIPTPPGSKRVEVHTHVGSSEEIKKWREKEKAEQVEDDEEE